MDGNEGFYFAFHGIADVNNKIDMHIIEYLLRQKEEVISELRDKVRLLRFSLVWFICPYIGMKLNVRSLSYEFLPYLQLLLAYIVHRLGIPFSFSFCLSKI